MYVCACMRLLLSHIYLYVWFCVFVSVCAHGWLLVCVCIECSVICQFVWWCVCTY